MATREFALGVIDGRAGRGHRSDYATWGVDEQWNYERGRQWAALVPRAVALKRNGEITAEAKRLVHTRHPRMPMECTSVRPPRLFFTSIAHGAHKPSILQAFSASLSPSRRNKVPPRACVRCSGAQIAGRLRGALRIATTLTSA